uniref:Prepilin peptidase n=1 Tax=Thermofilum pendens TaxID=2269 RepID=A0A7C4H3Y0_THEPE
MGTDLLFLADLARRAVVAGVLLLSGWSDYRTREVSDSYWVAGAAAAGPLLAYLYVHRYYYWQLHLLSILFAALLSAAVWRLRITGEADALAFIFIGVFEPPTCYHPLTLFPLASTVLFSGAAALAISLYNAIENVSRGALHELRGYSVFSKAAFLLALRYVTREEFEKKSYMFIPSTNEKGEPQLTLTTEPAPPPPGLEKFWASVLLPYVSLLAIGFLAYMLPALLLCP